MRRTDNAAASRIVASAGAVSIRGRAGPAALASADDVRRSVDYLRPAEKELVDQKEGRDG